jgi:two-component system nitrate/nitrite response regulator NarL
MIPKIKVAILEDHLSIIDGYLYRLSRIPEIEVVATGTYGEELQPMLKAHLVDVLLLDINLPTSLENNNPFPILFAIPRLQQQFPDLNILVITMLNQHSLIEALVDAGVSGYILKDDQGSIQELGKIVTMVASGGVYFSQAAYRDLRNLLSSAYLRLGVRTRAAAIAKARQLGLIPTGQPYSDRSLEEG